MSPYALLPDRIWDGLADAAQAGMAVVVRDACIDAVLPVSELPGDTPRVDLSGCTLIPGLMDAHVHYSDVMGPAFLAAGVTTIRDVGNDLEWILAERERHAADAAAGPAIVCCGHLHDGPNVFWPHMGRPHASADELRASVRHHIARGVDAVKLYAGVDLDLLTAGVQEAHAHRVFVLAHLGATTAQDAVRAGLDEFEHLAGCEVAWRAAAPEEDDAMIDLLLAHRVVINPTLVVWDRLGRILDRSFHHDSRRAWVHPCHRDIWDRYRSRFEPPEHRWRLQGPMVHLKRFLRRAHDRGVTVALGTDTPFPHLVPGMSVHDELAMYGDAGIPPVDALRSATSVNARVLGVEARCGAIRPGLTADLAAIRGNPLVRIEDVSNVVCTVHAGQRFEPGELLRRVQAAFDRTPDGAVTRDLLDYVDGNRPA
jgi:imidazolonepropionase-like amidohydrolase